MTAPTDDEPTRRRAQNAPDPWVEPDVIDLTEEEHVERAPSLEGPHEVGVGGVAPSAVPGRVAEDGRLRTRTFIHEVNADGVSHRYRAVAVPNPIPNGRSSSATASTTCVPRSTSSCTSSFAPTAETRPARAVPGTPSPVGVRIQGGSPTEALRLIEGVQPYTQTVDGNRIRLIAPPRPHPPAAPAPCSPCASGRRITVNFRQQRVAPQVVKSWTSDRALESGKTVHGCEYITPYRRRPEPEGDPAHRHGRPGGRSVFGRIRRPRDGR